MNIIFNDPVAFAKYDTPLLVLPSYSVVKLNCKLLKLENTMENLNWDIHFHTFSKEAGVVIGSMELSKG